MKATRLLPWLFLELAVVLYAGEDLQAQGDPNPSVETWYTFLGASRASSLDAALAVPGVKEILDRDGAAGLYADESKFEEVVAKFRESADNGCRRAVEFYVRMVRGAPEVFAWGVVEPEKGTYRFELPDVAVKTAQTYGRQLVASIVPYAGWDLAGESPGPAAPPEAIWWGNRIGFPADLDAYRAFVTALVERYDGDGTDDMPDLTQPVLYYEVDRDVEGRESAYAGDAARYIELVKATRAAARAASEGAEIVSAPGLGLDRRETKPFWTDFMRKGGLEQVDVLAWRYDSEREGARADTDAFERTLEFWNSIRGRGAGARPMWIVSLGTYAGAPEAPGGRGRTLRAQGEELQAAWYVKTFALALAGGVETLFPDVVGRWATAEGASAVYDEESGMERPYKRSLGALGDMADRAKSATLIAEGKIAFERLDGRLLVAWGKGFAHTSGGSEAVDEVVVYDLYGNPAPKDTPKQLSKIRLADAPLFIWRSGN